MCRTCVKEISVKVLEESGSHDHDAMLEYHTCGLPNHVKERRNEMLESNENIAPKPLHTKMQVEDMCLSATTRKLIKNYLIHLRRNKKCKIAQEHCCRN